MKQINCAPINKFHKNEYLSKIRCPVNFKVHPIFKNWLTASLTNYKGVLLPWPAYNKSKLTIIPSVHLILIFCVRECQNVCTVQLQHFELAQSIQLYTIWVLGNTGETWGQFSQFTFYQCQNLNCHSIRAYNLYNHCVPYLSYILSFSVESSFIFEL